MRVWRTGGEGRVGYKGMHGIGMGVSSGGAEREQEYVDVWGIGDAEGRV